MPQSHLMSAVHCDVLCNKQFFLNDFDDKLLMYMIIINWCWLINMYGRCQSHGNPQNLKVNGNSPSSGHTVPSFHLCHGLLGPSQSQLPCLSCADQKQDSFLSDLGAVAQPPVAEMWAKVSWRLMFGVCWVAHCHVEENTQSKVIW